MMASKKEQEEHQLVVRAVLRARKGSLDDLEAIRGMEDRFGSGEFYDLACFYSIASSKVDAGSDAQKEYRTKAIEYLARAIAADIAAGWTDLTHIHEDPDFETLRDLSEFKKLLEESEVDDSGSASPDD